MKNVLKLSQKEYMNIANIVSTILLLCILCTNNKLGNIF